MGKHTKYGYSIKAPEDALLSKWIFTNPASVISEFKNGVGSNSCVALVQNLLGMPETKYWCDGEKVLGHKIDYGTVIAAFIDGLYPSDPTGNHAAIYIKQGEDKDGRYIDVIDQWAENSKHPQKPPSYRRIMANPRKSRVDNADAFTVVLTSVVAWR